MSSHPAVVRTAERLARSAPSELEDARRSVVGLIVAAHELVPLLPTSTEDTDAVWALARRLAALPAPGASPRTLPSVPVADAAFRCALVGSVDAIRMCRQTLHMSGACWFAGAAGEDGCGDVLRTAHALS